jgi:ABC-2 type transport system permease protein
MTAPASTAPAQPLVGPAARRPHRPATLVDSIRAEWIKFRSVRSTSITIAIAVFLAVGIGALISWGAASHYSSDSAANRLTWDPTSISLSGGAFAQLAIAVLGVMFVAGEYASGMIRTSLAAVPRRWRWLAAKAAVYGVAVLILGEITSFVSFFVGQPIIGIWAPHATLGDPGVARAVIGGGLYLTGIGLLAIAVGALLRNTAAGIAVLVAFIFVLPVVSNALPASWRHPVQKWWPSNAGSQIASVVRTAHTLSPWAGLGWFIGFTAIVVAVAFFLLNKRDA